jgi:phage-related protein
MKREIIPYKDYFKRFIDKQDKETQIKIFTVFKYVQNEQIVSTKFLKKLKGTNGIYEIRVKSKKGIFRILCFFDDGNIVVLVNSFQKKTQKTPLKEIDKAKKLKNEYYENK